jgi:Ca2+-dependent lipid-binding protein
MEIQLQEIVPYIYALKASFLEMPHLDFTLKPMKTMDIMDVPGLSSWLRNIIARFLSEVMVEPNQFSILLNQIWNEKLYSTMVIPEHRKWKKEEKEA